jgi:multiple sugar transport system substrate-binding protein
VSAHLRRTTIAIVALAVGLAGCGTNDDTTAGPAPDTDPDALSGTIEVWGMGAEGEAMSVLAEMFMDEYPDVTVNVTPVAWDVAHDRLVTSVAGGRMPDVTQLGTTWMGEFAMLDALDPTPETIDGGSFYEGAWNTTVVEDTSYGVPWYVETRLLYYRTDLAEEAGWTEPPGDWDELKQMAADLQEAGSQHGISLGLGLGSWQTYLPFAWSNGVEVLDDNDEFTLDDPGNAEALEYYASFFDEGLTSAQPEGFDITPAFIQGTFPMFFSGPWHMALIEETGGAEIEGMWTVAPMPQRDSATSFVGGSNLVVSQDTENRDAAWAFVEFLSRPDVQATWYQEVGALPAVQEAWESGELAEDEHLAMFGEQLNDAKAPPPIPTWEEVAAAIDDQIERAAVGDVPPEDAVATMQSNAESIGTGLQR